MFLHIFERERTPTHWLIPNCEFSKQILNKLYQDLETFLGRILKGHELWLYHPKDKAQSKQWLPTDGSGLLKAKAMATGFWDA